MKFIRDLFTEDDGVSWCLAKVTSAVALVSYLGNATYAIYTGHAPDMGSFGSGLFQVLSGCGVLIAGKQITQRKES